MVSALLSLLVKETSPLVNSIHPNTHIPTPPTHIKADRWKRQAEELQSKLSKDIESALAREREEWNARERELSSLVKAEQQRREWEVSGRCGLEGRM